MRGFRELWGHLSRRRRMQAFGVLGLMFMGAFAELLTLGAILPFLALVADPNAVSRYPKLGTVLALLGANDRHEFVIMITAIFAIVAVCAAAVRIFLAWASQKLVFRVGYDLGVAVYQRILYQPYSYHVSRNTSETIAALGKVQNVVGGMMMPAMQALTSTIIAVFILGGLLVVDARAAGVSAVSFGMIYLAVSVATRRRLGRNSQVISRTQTQRIQTVQEGLGGIRDVLLDHAQPIYLDKFAKVDTQLRDAQANNALIGSSPRFVIEGAGMVMIAVLALYLSGEPGGLIASLPVLGALALGAQRLLPLLQLIYNGWTQIMGSRASFLDIMTTLDQPIAPELLAGPNRVPLSFEQDVTFDGVFFRYAAAGPWVLRDIAMRFPKGGRIGFVGRTGSGKSTAMDLVMGLLSPTEGAIKIDGRALDPMTRAAWQGQIAHVPQHIYLSDASIFENIAFGIPRARIDEERVRTAAAKADIAAFIEEQPEGYDTVVGERGIRLSGGQRQRIGIARALYKRSMLLVLDEATSALDDATEASVMAAIDRLGGELTVLIIAHRVTTLRNCDIIYRLDRGMVVKQGTYAEVIADAKAGSLPAAAQ